MLDIAQRFLDLLTPLFPPGAELRTLPPMDGLRFNVSWKLKNDPVRENKRSRKIILVLSEEAQEDYADGGLDTRQSMEDRIVHFITEQIKSFDPNHDMPYGRPDPEETWYLT